MTKKRKVGTILGGILVFLIGCIAIIHGFYMETGSELSGKLMGLLSLIIGQTSSQAIESMTADSRDWMNLGGFTAAFGLMLFMIGLCSNEVRPDISRR